MLIVLEIVAILFMIIMMFVGIWGFILFNQIFGQMRYKNYLLEKMAQNIHMIAAKNEFSNNEKNA